MILAPRALLGVADQIGACDVVMVANLGPAKAGEELFRAVRVDATFLVATLAALEMEGLRLEDL